MTYKCDGNGADRSEKWHSRFLACRLTFAVLLNLPWFLQQRGRSWKLAVVKPITSRKLTRFTLSLYCKMKQTDRTNILIRGCDLISSVLEIGHRTMRNISSSSWKSNHTIEQAKNSRRLNAALVNIVNIVIWELKLPISVAAPSKASVYGRSLAANAVSNPAWSMDIFFLWVLCVVR